jgi:hypothetical protein
MSKDEILSPREYLKIKEAQLKIIKAAERRIAKAREKADKSPPPKNRRPVNADDIVTGAIIWHKRAKKYGGDCWNIVEEPLHYGDAFKAYVADDGCRYGRDGAYIEVL